MITSSNHMLQGMPLFPLPDFFLFPGAVAPLHIFEPRYRQMISDLLDSSGRLVLAAYRPGGPRLATGPAVESMGGLGEIVHHETLADGRFLIWVLGLSRVSLSEVPSDRLYRKASVTPVVDREVEQDVEQELTPLLREAIVCRAPRGKKLEGELSLGLLADILLNTIPLDAERTARVYAESCAELRARRALQWHQDHQV